MADAPPAGRPNWDQVVDRISIASNYLCLERSAGHWQNVFGAQQVKRGPQPPPGQLGQLRRALEKLMIQSGTNWRGTGAAAFRQHVKALITAVEAIQSQYEGLQKATAESATHLKAALDDIDIPLDRLAEVRQAQEAYRAGTPYNVTPFWFMQNWYQSNPAAASAFQRWFIFSEVAAQGAHERLESAYQADLALIPPAADIPMPGVNVGPGQDGVGGAGKGRTAGLDTKSGLDGAGAGAGLSPGGLQTPVPTAGLNSPSASEIKPPDLSTTTPPDLPGVTDPSGIGDLPGIGDPDTSGLAGLGGLGAGGGGVPGLGAGTGAPGSATSGFGAPGPGARGLGVASVAGANPNLAGMGMYPPMMPMSPHGAAGGQGGNNTDNMLQEDEVKVMFGFDSDPCGEPEPEIPRGGVLDA